MLCCVCLYREWSKVQMGQIIRMSLKCTTWIMQFQTGPSHPVCTGKWFCLETVIWNFGVVLFDHNFCVFADLSHQNNVSSNNQPDSNDNNPGDRNELPPLPPGTSVIRPPFYGQSNNRKYYEHRENFWCPALIITDCGSKTWRFIITNRN